MPKKKREKPISTSHQTDHHGPEKDPVTSVEVDSEEELWDNPNLPSQEHCTWLLNVIQLHAKKIANETIKTYEAKVDSQISLLKEEIQMLRKETDKLQEVIDNVTATQKNVKRLNHENSKAMSEVRDVKTIIDAIEQCQYENNLQVVGLPESKDNGDVDQEFYQDEQELLGG